jgi:hypothetical protein
VRQPEHKQEIFRACSADIILRCVWTLNVGGLGNEPCVLVAPVSPELTGRWRKLPAVVRVTTPSTDQRSSRLADLRPATCDLRKRRPGAWRMLVCLLNLANELGRVRLVDACHACHLPCFCFRLFTLSLPLTMMLPFQAPERHSAETRFILSWQKCVICSLVFGW